MAFFVMRILKIFNSEPSMGVFEDASIPCTARFKNFIFTRWLPPDDLRESVLFLVGFVRRWLSDSLSSDVALAASACVSVLCSFSIHFSIVPLVLDA